MENRGPVPGFLGNINMKRTAKQVADFLQNHVRGTEGPHDWDNFTSIRISDERLESIRLRCLKLEDELPEERFAEMKEIIKTLTSE
jgi:hypothetical protein